MTSGKLVQLGLDLKEAVLAVWKCCADNTGVTVVVFLPLPLPTDDYVVFQYRD